MKEVKFEYKKISSKFIVSDLAYQRQVDMNRVKRIVSNFNECLVNPIKVSKRADGKYYVFDGQHTLSALILRNEGKPLMVDCKVYTGLTEKDEAKLFAEQNGIARAVETIAKFKALYQAGDIDVTEFRDSTESVGIKMDFTKGGGDNKIIACSTAFKIFNKLGKEEYIRLLKLIKETWNGEADSFNKHILSGVYVLIKTYKKDLDDKTFVKQLSKVAPVVILRNGKAVTKPGDKKYAQEMLEIYNKKLRRNKLENRL